MRALGRESDILGKDYFSHIDLSADELFADGDRDGAEKAAKEQQARIKRDLWDPFSADFKSTIARDDCRTMVWDQADEFNEYLRLTHFGKLEKNPQIASGPINMEFKGLVREAVRRRKNLVLIHQIKQKYRSEMQANGKEKSVPLLDVTGAPVLERRANRSADYLIDSFIQTFYDEKEKQFFIRILNAKKNKVMNGEVVPACEWITLMSFLDPMVEPEEWL